MSRPVPHARGRARRVARLSLLALAPVAAACLGESTGPTPPEPYEGTWRLVRLGGQPLPLRVDGTEVTSETITLLYLGSGYLTDRWREHGATIADRQCIAWVNFTVNGSRISTREAPSQPQQGTCARGVTAREFVLDGDTLRSAGGAAFQLGTRVRAYVRE